MSSTSTVLCTAAACRAVISECCDVQRTTTEHEASRRLKTEFLLQVGARLRCMCRCRCRTSPHAPSCTCAQLCRSDRPHRLCSIAWHDRPHQSYFAVARAVFLPQCLYLYSVVIPLSSTASPQTRTSGCCWSQQRTGTYRGITSTEGVAQYSVDHRAIREARGYSALYYRIHSIQYYLNKWPQ